jgi:hypothetical protein
MRGFRFRSGQFARLGVTKADGSVVARLFHGQRTA